MNQIICDIKDCLCTLTIKRPKQLNSLNINVLNDLNTKLDWILTKNEIRVVILTGYGQKSFIAGADIEEMNDLNYEEAKKFADLGQKLTLKMENYKLALSKHLGPFRLLKVKYNFL